MRRALFAFLLLAPGALEGQVTSPFTLYIHDTTGVLPDKPLTASYQLSEAAVGGFSLSPTVIYMKNTSQNDVYSVVALVSASATSAAVDPNFFVSGVYQIGTLPAGGSVLFNVNFAPTTTGTISGFLNITFETQQGGPSSVVNASVLTGTAIQSPGFSIGSPPTIPLPQTYQFASTAVGGATPMVLTMVNTSQNTIALAAAVVSTAAGSVGASPNFSVTGFPVGQALPPGVKQPFTVNFAPSVTGETTGYLTVEFQIQVNNCTLSSATNICPGALVNVSTLNGTGTPAVLTLSYPTATGPQVLLPASSHPLNFPATSLSATSPITFTLTNATLLDIPNPGIFLPVVNLNAPGAFALDASGVPPIIAAGQSANFIVTFEPGQTGYADGVVQIGSNSCIAPVSTEPLSSCYPIAGEGVVVSDIDFLQISYTDSTGIRTSPQAATPISFPQVVPGNGARAALTFYILNPAASSDGPVTLSGITVSGAGFSLAGVPAAPIIVPLGPCSAAACNGIASIAPFQLIFQPTASGTFGGMLSIGDRQFSVTALAVTSPIPSFSLTLATPIGSQEQEAVTVQLSAPSAVAAIGTIKLQFTPLANLTDDAAIVFTSTGGRELNINVSSGSQTATYAGAPGITFQTGTTAGTITFAVAFPDTTTYTQSFTIPAEAVQITSLQANRESPNLLVTVSGYDNTYSASELSFTFYDTTGKAIGSPIQLSAAANFQDLFFSNNTMGGVFSLEASFPVTGDVTQIGSVTVGIANSIGESTSSATFQ